MTSLKNLTMAWRLPDNCLMTACQLTDDCLMTARRLPDNCLTNMTVTTVLSDNHCMKRQPLYDDHCVVTTTVWRPVCTIVSCPEKDYFTLDYKNMTFCVNGRQDKTDNNKMMVLWGCAADAQPKNTNNHFCNLIAFSLLTTNKDALSDKKNRTQFWIKFWVC
jgi:hypothetical protein